MSLALLRIWRAPAVQAALLQLAAFVPMLLVVTALARAGHAPGYGGAALIQGLLAALLTWWRGLASWWRAIQLIFPLALWATLGLALPPVYFLAGFSFLLLLYWSTFRTQVPYYPSGARTWAAVAALLPKDRALRVIDIGSGLGGLVLELARLRPEAALAGIELAPLPWLVSRLRAGLSGGRARFLRGDYEALDFAHYDAVFAYLSPAAMGALWRKASAEMRPGSMLLSYEFAIADHPPSQTVNVAPGKPVLYVWNF